MKIRLISALPVYSLRGQSHIDFRTHCVIMTQKNITPSLFPLLSWISTENKTKLKKLFISNTKSGGAQHHKHTNCT